MRTDISNPEQAYFEDLEAVSAKISSFITDSPVSTYSVIKPELKKNMLFLHSLEQIFSVINSSLKKEEVIFLSYEDAQNLTESYGKTSNISDDANALARLLIIHLPRIIKTNIDYQINKNPLYLENILFRKYHSRSSGNFSDQNLCDISVNFSTLLNSFLPSKFIRRDDEYLYSFNPYNLTSFNFTDILNQSFECDPNISEFDQIWAVKHYFAATQFLTYFLSDILNLEQLNFKGVDVTQDDIYNNVGYPYSLKNSHLQIIKTYDLDIEKLRKFESSYKLNQTVSSPPSSPRLTSFPPKETSDEKIFMKNTNDSDIFLNCGFYSKSIFRDSHDFLATNDKYKEINNKLLERIIDVAQEEQVKMPSYESYTQFLINYENMSRKCKMVLNILFNEDVGSKLSLKKIIRPSKLNEQTKSFSQQIIESIMNNSLESKICDIVFAFSVNLHSPESLSETIFVAEEFEEKIKYYADLFGVEILHGPSFELKIDPWLKKENTGVKLNLAYPEKLMKMATFLKNDDGEVMSQERVEELRYNPLFIKMVEVINKNLTDLINKSYSGIFRNSKLLIHLDFKSCHNSPNQYNILDKNESYVSEYDNSGKNASIRITGSDIKDSSLEIRGFGSNVQFELMMPNENFNENLYKQSKFLEIIALKVYDSINEVRENIELSDADSQKWQRDTFKRSRSFSNVLDESMLSLGK